MLYRRALLSGTAALVFAAVARAIVVEGAVPWAPDAGAPPPPFVPGPWHVFTPAEGRVIEAIVDRIIPPDPDTPGGKNAGCAVFIDRQLAGPFGRGQGDYDAAPFAEGTKQQGLQARFSPAEQYRRAIAAIDAHSSRTYGKTFADLGDNDKDAVVGALEKGEIAIAGVDGHDFWTMLLKNTRQGFFADPIYGGNRDMAGWKMVGFPGARYDYSDWIGRHNEPYPEPPIGLTEAPLWIPR